MLENMREIPNFEGYYATQDGRIYSAKRNIFLKPRFNKDGYLRVGVRRDGKTYTRFVHTLVALAFIDNPEGKPTVNHKNEIKTDNRVENLEWATCKEQINYGTRTERAAKTNSRSVRCIETGEIFESAREAAAARKTGAWSIRDAASGIYKTCLGQHWEYVEKK